MQAGPSDSEFRQKMSKSERTLFCPAYETRS